MHNYPIDYQHMTKIIHPNLQKQLENFDGVDSGSFSIPSDTISPFYARVAREIIDNWKFRNYPKSVEENKQIFEKYSQFLESHGIFPILFLPPMVKDLQDEFPREKLDELFSFIYDLMNRYRFALVDGWKIPGFNDHDFMDICHMNLSGAQKFSKILNDLVMKLESQR